jgi:hypothetical protein
MVCNQAQLGWRLLQQGVGGMNCLGKLERVETHTLTDGV